MSKSPDSGNDTSSEQRSCSDLDCDGWPDLVFTSANSLGQPVRVYWGGPDRYAEERFTEIADTAMTKSVALSDLDRDGDLDLVISRLNDEDGGFQTGSYVVYTTGLDPWTYTIVTLPTSGAHQALAADFDDDGWPDIFFSNAHDDLYSHRIASWIYWGGPDGFSVAARTNIPTNGAFGASAADLDSDGRLDLVVSNYYDGTSRLLESSIDWGDGQRFASMRRTTLPTTGARANIPYDVDGDGWLDLLFVNHTDGNTMEVPSFLYWGGADCFSEQRRDALWSVGPHTASFADLDLDGQTDLVFSNQRKDRYWSGTVESQVFLGGGDGTFPVGPDYSLQTNHAAGQTVADLDGDGWIDIAFADFAHNTPPFESYVYWGSETGPNTRTVLHTNSVDGVAAFVGETGF